MTTFLRLLCGLGANDGDRVPHGPVAAWQPPVSRGIPTLLP